MKCKRCKQGPIEYLYRQGWEDIYYCMVCMLGHTVDLRKQLELIDHDLRQQEEYGQ
jgi:hypothetical protein